MKPIFIRTRIACVLVSIFIIMTCGCSGGDGPVAPKLVVGSISGPGTFSESTFPTFILDASGDSGIVTDWKVTPESAGWFTSINPTRVMFSPAQVEADFSAEIRVTVKPSFGDLVTRTFDIVILNDASGTVTQLNVSEIIGSKTIPGGSWATYGVETSGDTGVKCSWSVEPPTAGTLTHPHSRYTNFATMGVSSDTPALLTVNVQSDNSGPVTKTLAVTIVPGTPVEPSLSVNNISGPTTVIENETASYVIAASGDTGIGYQWSVDPPDAGILSDPISPATDFTATPPDQLIVFPYHAKISVIVKSDHFGPAERTKDVSIVNIDPLISWIESPKMVIERTSETYIINAEPYFNPLQDDPMPLRWEVDPIYAGVFVKTNLNPGYEDYYISSAYTPEVLFQASEVPYDFPAEISVYYFEQQDDGSMLKKLIDTVDITILNDYSKPETDHWATPSAIVGPTEIAETMTDVFYFGLPDLDPNFDYKWKLEVIDDWEKGMPYFGNNPNPYPGTVQPTRGPDGKWNWHLVEVIPADFDMTTWLLLKAECPTGTESFILCVMPIIQPCIFTTEIWKPRPHSQYLDPELSAPTDPIEPDLEMPIFEPWGEWTLKPGDVVRMFAFTNSYFGTDVLRIKWETEPPGAVHFIGDYPFIYPEEIEVQWTELGERICDPGFPTQCGSHYFMEGGGMMIVPWVEMKCMTDSTFDLVLTVESLECNTAIRVVRFNKQ